MYHNHATEIRHDWTLEEISGLFNLPFSELLFQAQSIHRRYFATNEVQVSTLLSIKTGGCPEDCKYCSQSARYDTDVAASRLLDINSIKEQAARAREAGATRFCMGAAWRSPKDRDLPALTSIIKEIKNMGMETCMTLGMLTPTQASALAEAGLDYYNHNIDTSEDFYPSIVSSHQFQDRLETLQHVRAAGMKVCCGGIVGLGESIEDRQKMLQTLANLPEHPESVPVNMLVKVKGTPLEDAANSPSSLDFVRVIAAARIMMPLSMVRLSAGREAMSDEMQALCFFAGANSIFYGETLLTQPNPTTGEDMDLFKRLGIQPMARDSDNSHAFCKQKATA